MTAGTRAMQNKKDQTSNTTQKQEQAHNAQSLFSFVGNIKAEFKKITWTSKDELISYTKIVIIATSLMGIGIFSVDMLIQGVLAGLSEIVRLLIG